MTHRPLIVALLLGLLLFTAGAAHAQWTILKDVSVDLSTYRATDPYVYLSAGVDEHGVGGVFVYWIDADEQTIVAQQYFPLGPGDLVVNATTKKATLRFPGSTLTWTEAVGPSKYARVTDFAEVVVLDHSTHTRTQRVIDTGAMVVGTLAGAPLDTRTLATLRPGSANITRELIRDLVRTR